MYNSRKQREDDTTQLVAS